MVQIFFGSDITPFLEFHSGWKMPEIVSFFQALEMDDNSRIKFMDDEDSTTSSEEETNVSIRSVAFDLPKKVADKIENHNNKPCQREKKVTPIPRQVSRS